MRLIDAAVATDTTKQVFDLTIKDFQGASFPALKARGLGTGDSIRIWEYIADDWQDTGVTLDEDTTSRLVEAVGRYAVDVSLSTAGPVSCVLDSSGR